MQGERSSSEVVSQFLYWSFIITLVFSLLIAMRSFAGEREQGTLVLLQTSPAGDWTLVFGKYLGSMAFLTILTASTIYLPLLIARHGNLQLGQLFAGYFGLLLAGSAATAIGIFASTLAPNQLLAAVVSAAIVVVLTPISMFISQFSDPPLDDFFSFIDLYYRHFHHIQDGSIYLRSLIFYPSMTFFFLLAGTRVLTSRRWR